MNKLKTMSFDDINSANLLKVHGGIVVLIAMFYFVSKESGFLYLLAYDVSIYVCTLRTNMIHNNKVMQNNILYEEYIPHINLNLLASTLLLSSSAYNTVITFLIVAIGITKLTQQCGFIVFKKNK